MAAIGTLYPDLMFTTENDNEKRRRFR